MIRLWNVSDNHCYKTIATPSQVSALEFESDSQMLLSAHGYGHARLKLWDLNTYETVADFKGHDGRILNIAVSPVTKKVVSLASDETLRVWDIFETENEEEAFVDKLESGSELGTHIAR